MHATVASDLTHVSGSAPTGCTCSNPRSCASTRSFVQQILAHPDWAGRLTDRDRKALMPLFWNHVNPYGKFTLDMSTHLDLEPATKAA